MKDGISLLSLDHFCLWTTVRRVQIEPVDVSVKVKSEDPTTVEDRATRLNAFITRTFTDSVLKDRHEGLLYYQVYLTLEQIKPAVQNYSHTLSFFSGTKNIR